MADLFGSLAPNPVLAGRSIPASYNTALNPLDEAAYRSWVQENNVPTNVNAAGPQDYDMRGFWQALQQGNPKAASAIDPNDNRLHYPDFWKTPLHETFSNESQWASPNAPQWTPDDRLIDISGHVLFDDKKQRAGIFGSLAPGGF